MKNIQIVFALMLGFLAACNKEDQPGLPSDPAPETTKRLALMTNETLPENWFKLQYDSQGRVVLAEDDEDKYTVTYTGNKIHVVNFRKTENQVVFDFTGQLNAQGNIVSGSGVSRYTQEYQEKHSFTYDAEGRLTQKVLDRNDGEMVYTFKYFYKNANLDSFDVYVNGVYDYGGAYEYYSDKADKSGMNWEQFDIPNTFTGKVNTNMASKYTGYRDGKESWHVDFSYQFDADGYPVESQSKYSNGNIYKFSYKYE